MPEKPKKSWRTRDEWLAIRGPHPCPPWPPFEKGNIKQLRTGHRSERSVVPLAEALAETLVAERPEAAEHPAALAAWARAEARCLLLADGAFLDEDGKAINSKDIAQFEGQAARMRAALGLDLRSEAELRKSQAEAVNAAVDLDGIRSRGQVAWASRELDRVLADGDEDVT